MNDIQNGDSFVTLNARESPISSDVESSGLISSDSLRRVKRRKRKRSTEPETESTGTSTEERPSKCSHVEPDFELPSESPLSLKDEAGPSAVTDEASTSQNKEPLDSDHQSITNKSVEIIKETNNGDIFEDTDEEGGDEAGDYSTLLNSDSESDDDGLPTVSFCKGDWSISDVKENTIIWTKYGKYPFWPALVDSLNKRTKKLKVYFLGWPDRHPIPMSYKNKKNFAPYDYENTVKYKAHSFSDLKDQVKIDYFKKWFDLALREADTLQQLRIENKVQGPPRYQYEMMAEMRPSSYSFDSSRPQYSFSNTDNDNDGDKSLNNNNDDGDKGEEESDTNYDLSDSEDDQPEDTSSPYCFSRLMEHFEKNESFIEEVCLGKASSELHQSYSGTKSDRQKMRKASTGFGPAKLTESQELKIYKFIEKVLIRTRGEAGFTYIYDVIIPEVC
ncbi:PREDICTED: uncharacterized protein LOC109582313 [Amphimedon queenslandica]|uniref:PWWP domain-containing protein n=1 Tax=Amphimedon queenslandica TaxID=400682 RepID=A0AAN0J704_AMPQE|nr:PREDICTED: uncharacterized protein LOC109582313 [Amphimedon queenslandica]|eukprot:XP_019852542.1 PREDICTED: uncharacterized protein LOC109582313 [Amphimedon queenslandica]